MAGGTCLTRAMNARLISPRGLIDLSNITDLTGISKGPRSIEVGAMICWHDLDRAWHLNGGCEALVDSGQLLIARRAVITSPIENIEEGHQMAVACMISWSWKSPDHSIVRSSHIGVFARSRPWKRGLSVWAGPPSAIAAIWFT